MTDLQIGGTPRVVKELAVRLRPFGFVPRVACLAPWGPVADELQDAGVAVDAFGAVSVMELPKTARRVRRWASDADVVFSFLVHANAVATLAVLGRSVPLVQSIQTTQPRPAWHWWLQGLVARAADAVVVPSISVARIAAERCGVPPERLVVIPNAVDIASSSAPTSDAKKCRVGFVGRLDPIKRIPDLIAAVATLPAVELHVYGDGTDRSTIEATTDALGLRERVTLHGSVPAPSAALQAMNVLVLPSDAEGFGLVLIEAMAAGVPVVATNVDGIRDVVTDGVTGLLVPPRDPAALAGAICRIRDDSLLRARLIEAGRAAVLRDYTWANVLGRYATLLHALATRADATAGAGA